MFLKSFPFSFLSREILMKNLPKTSQSALRKRENQV